MLNNRNFKSALERYIELPFIRWKHFIVYQCLFKHLSPPRTKHVDVKLIKVEFVNESRLIVLRPIWCCKKVLMKTLKQVTNVSGQRQAVTIYRSLFPSTGDSSHYKGSNVNMQSILTQFFLFNHYARLSSITNTRHPFIAITTL